MNSRDDARPTMSPEQMDVIVRAVFLFTQAVGQAAQIVLRRDRRTRERLRRQRHDLN